MSGTFVMGREIVCSVLFVFIALPASQSISAPLATTLLDCDGQQIRNQFTSIFCAQIVVNPEALFAFREEATVSVTRGIPPKVSASAFSDDDTFAGLPGGRW